MQVYFLIEPKLKIANKLKIHAMIRNEKLSIVMNSTVLEKQELRGLVADCYNYQRI